MAVDQIFFAGRDVTLTS